MWAIFIADSGRGFPNFYPIGVFTARNNALEELNALPRDMNYQLLRLPLNRLFAYRHSTSGKIVGMDGISHEHYHFKDDSETVL